ncbi:MAG: AAA family ATPase, partial [Fuerstiella sp.]
MLPIVTGYDVTETLCETTGSLLLRTGPVGGRPSTILKLLNKAYPSPQELARFRQEYEITRRLDAPGVIKVYGLETYENSLMILMEDIGGESLSRWLQERTLDLETFLSLAVRITETLGDIHSASIIHKDISCSNIIWNATTDELRIIDFGVSTRMSRANSVSGECETRDGTLAYMSPERTGLMNRGVDYRTDFYSLGVTFYEMLTGRLPFSTNDTVELVHCHIARTPPRPNSVNSPVPVAVSEIVMKLMAKEAADRYQSAKGIQADLEYALAQLRATQHIDEFELGRQDYCSQLNVSQTLYGRTGEVKILQDSFRRVAAEGRPEMVLVAGYSGVGKTSLVREIHRTITESRGLFAAGKFDQFNRNIPYSAVVQAFQGLVQQLLAEPTERVDEWRRVLLEKLDTSGQLIVDVIPDVEFLIGPQPAVPPLGPTETQNRFNRVFQDFVSVFSHKLHPLALFLDDLQWADAASLQLLRVLLGELGTCHLLVMGAYRDNEVGPTHPLLSVVDALETENIAVNTVVLQPLAEAHIAQLLSDTLSTPPDRVHSLCQLLLDRTGGNPFFLNQFLVDLYDADLLNFDRGQMAWVWQIDQINADKTTDNVVERLILKIGELPADTR